MTSICGFRNPEDLRALPDRRSLLVSQAAAMIRPGPGQLMFFDTVSQTITPAYPQAPVPTASASAAESPNGPSTAWGAGDCPGAPGADFSPLGISVQQRDDGRWQVAAANLGARVSIEMFELTGATPAYSLTWRGCVPLPPEVMPNSVALLRSGGFVASHMYDRRAPTLFGLNSSMLKSQLRMASGYAFEWQPARDGQKAQFRVLEGSHGAFPNGIALSADEASVFLALTGSSEIIKLDRASGARLGAVALKSPDNLSWDDQGFLLVASLEGTQMQHFLCIQKPDENCGLAFRILRVDPATLQAETLLAHEGAPMGAVTTALPLGDALYLGSFTGDRIVKLPYQRRQP